VTGPGERDRPGGTVPSDALFGASSQVSQAFRKLSTVTADVFPLSNGYLALGLTDPARARPSILLRLTAQSQRTLVVTNKDASRQPTDWLSGLGPSYAFAVVSPRGPVEICGAAPSSLDPGAILFCVPRELISAKDDSVESYPRLSIRMLGVGPDGIASREARSQAFQGADDIILFDRVEHNVLQGVQVTGNVHVIPYVYESFDSSIQLADNLLRKLADNGSRMITIVVEGNPEVLDVAPGIRSVSRTISVIPARPISLLGVDKICQAHHLSHPGDEYSLLSGLPGRHPLGESGLIAELACYLEARIPCVLVEMFVADWSILTRALVGRKGSLAVMTNLFSPGQQIWTGDEIDFPGLLADRNLARGSLMSVFISPWGSGD
jgi:hypothetical protein